MTDLMPVNEIGKLSDEEIVERVCNGDTAIFEVLMRRYNQRIYRTVRAILRNDSETEDAMQQAYLNAFTHLRQFRGAAKFSTWLVKIAVHEAFARLRKHGGEGRTIDQEFYEDVMNEIGSNEPGPEERAIASELGATMESLIAELPESYRTVLVLREVEGLTTAETAECLEVSEDVVKTRLHRSRAMLRDALYDRAGVSIRSLFPFHDPRCNRVVDAVFAEIQQRGLIPE